uniref:Ig-like domain-containing protein n=1 Tax=Sinocyclocheilus anshuiensis TaxID=1608454 RepID=A0A671K2N5_9TELE
MPRNSWLCFVSAGCSISGNEGSVEISRYSGESVFLSCLLKCTARHKPDSEFRWKLPNYREINPTELHRRYQGRFHMFDRSSGNLSLLISDLTEEDEGLYSCETAVLKSTQSLNELSISYAGESVILPCSCEDPKTKPEHFEWKRAAVNETLVSDAEEINGRFQMIRDSPHNLFLRISNLTETDGGLYVCSVNGKQSRHVTLTLTGKTPQINSAVINALDYQYYLIFLVFLLCLMLLLAAGCIFWRFARGTNTHTTNNRELCTMTKNIDCYK